MNTKIELAQKLIPEIEKIISAKTTGTDFLKKVDYCLTGYWLEDHFFSQIQIPKEAEAHHEKTEITGTHSQGKIILTISLHYTLILKKGLNYNEIEELGTFKLIFDEGLDFIDENWKIYPDIPEIKYIR